jgi:hypothetical protein
MCPSLRDPRRPRRAPRWATRLPTTRGCASTTALGRCARTANAVSSLTASRSCASRPPSSRCALQPSWRSKQFDCPGAWASRAPSFYRLVEGDAILRSDPPALPRPHRLPPPTVRSGCCSRAFLEERVVASGVDSVVAQRVYQVPATPRRLSTVPRRARWSCRTHVTRHAAGGTSCF